MRCRVLARCLGRAALASVVALSPGLVLAQQQDNGEDVAKQLANPVSSLISVPIQVNLDDDFGLTDAGSVTRINVQPVYPFTLNDDWNLVSRTILPVLDFDNLPAQGIGETGLGDTVQSLFFSPQAPTSGGWIWGAGPVMLLPTATEDVLGSEKWGIGPTAVVLRQQGPWTYGALANHIESFAGDDDRADLSTTFLQPFLTYVSPKRTTYAINLESSYDWEAESWTVPINIGAYQLLRLGNQLVQVGGGIRYWIESPDAGPEGLGFRFSMTLLFPR